MTGSQCCYHSPTEDPGNRTLGKGKLRVKSKNFKDEVRTFSESKVTNVDLKMLYLVQRSDSSLKKPKIEIEALD